MASFTCVCPDTPIQYTTLPSSAPEHSPCPDTSIQYTILPSSAPEHSPWCLVLDAHVQVMKAVLGPIAVGSFSFSSIFIPCWNRHLKIQNFLLTATVARSWVRMWMNVWPACWRSLFAFRTAFTWKIPARHAWNAGWSWVCGKFSSISGFIKSNVSSSHPTVSAVSPKVRWNTLFRTVT